MTAIPGAMPQLAVGYAGLAERHLPDLWSVAHWLADDPSAAKGLVRDALYAGLRQYGDLGEETERRSWFFRLICDAYRAGSSAGAAHSGRAPAAGTASDDDLERAVRSLPVRVRIPILLSDVAGLSYGEIAQALGLPVGAVRARIAEARSRLVPVVESTSSVFRPADDGSGKRGIDHVEPHVDRARASG